MVLEQEAVLITFAEVSATISGRVCTPLVGGLHLIGAWRGIRDVRGAALSLPLIVVFPAVSLAIFVASVAVAVGGLAAYAPLVYLCGLFLALVVAVSVLLPMILRADT